MTIGFNQQFLCQSWSQGLYRYAELTVFLPGCGRGYR